MLEKYYPYEYAPDVFRIDYGKLRDRGFRAVIFDIDNTLAPHGKPCGERTERLLREIGDIGLKVLLLTNNDEERVRLFNRNIGADYLCEAGKPDPAAYEAALRRLNVPKEQAVSIGDQMFVDTVGANGAGVPNILVHFIAEPGARRIGVKRYLERAVLFVYRTRKKYRHRLGDILKDGGSE